MNQAVLLIHTAVLRTTSHLLLAQFNFTFKFVLHLLPQIPNMALIPMALGTCKAIPATTLALEVAYRMTTPSTATMVQGEAPRVGAITIKLVVGTTQSTDSSSIPQVATKQQMTSHTTKDTETIVVRLWPILFIVL